MSTKEKFLYFALILTCVAVSVVALMIGNVTSAGVLILVAQVFTAAITLAVLVRAHEWATRTHQREIIQEFGRRYQALLLQQSQGNVRDFLPYFRAFWSLQFEQYRMWLSGLVPDRTYRYWLESRWRDHHSTYKIYSHAQIRDLERLRKSIRSLAEDDAQSDFKNEYLDYRLQLGKTNADGWSLVADGKASPGWGSSRFQEFMTELFSLRLDTLQDSIEEIMRKEKIHRQDPSNI